MTFKFGTRFGPGPEKVSAKTFFFPTFDQKFETFGAAGKNVTSSALSRSLDKRDLKWRHSRNFSFLPLAESMRFYLLTCVSPDTSTYGVSRIFSLTPFASVKKN